MDLVAFKEKKNKIYSKIPKEILEDALLSEMIKELPENYNFEIPKTIWRIRSLKKDLNKEIITVVL